MGSVLVVGGTGFLGSRVAAAVEGLGCPAEAAGRSVLDLSNPPSPGDLSGLVRGRRAVVNCAGAWEGDLFALHVEGPTALAEACRAEGVPLVHVSALGCAGFSGRGFAGTKAEFERRIFGTPGVTVVRPSLLIGDGGRSFGWMCAAALSPLPCFPGGGRVAPVLVEDAAEACARAALFGSARTPFLAVDVCGETETDPPGVVEAYRRAAGLRGGVSRLPGRVASFLALVGSAVPGSPLTGESAALLAAGSASASKVARALLGRDPRGLSVLSRPGWGARVRGAGLPVLGDLLARGSLAAVWLGTAFATAFLWPVADSLALLASAGVPSALAPAALWGSAALDALLGLATLLRPGKRLWSAQFALVAFYTAFVAAALPEFAAHPFGPLLKNLPILAMLAWLHSKEERR